MEKCVICKNTSYSKLFTVEGKDIIRCDSCGLVKTRNFKLPDYKNYHRDESYEASEKFFKNIFETRYNIISKYKQNGKVLDIGAATGVMLDIFKEHGFDTYGIEPSKSAESAIKKGHIIKKTTLEKSKFPSHFFDVIIANHVLEHIEDPNSFLSYCKKYLKKNGLLYIDVPNFGSLSSQMMGSHWKYILPNEHVHHFTPETLSKLLEFNGFKVSAIYTRSGVLETSNPLKYLLDELIGMRKNFFTDILGIPGNILSTLLNRGSSVGIISYEK